MREGILKLIYRMRSFLIAKFQQYNVTLPYLILIILALVIVVVGINIFVELTDTLPTEGLKAYDQNVTEFVTSFRRPALTNYFIAVTEIGDLYGYIVVLAITILVSLLVFKRWKYVVQISLVLILSAVSNLVLKRFIDRARPDIDHMVIVKTLSYPSGHAMSAIAFYGFVMYLFYKYIKNIYVKILAMFLTAVLILSIGISRIYLGVHFPSDILGGYIAGFIWVVFCILVFNLVEVFRRDPETEKI